MMGTPHLCIYKEDVCHKNSICVVVHGKTLCNQRKTANMRIVPNSAILIRHVHIPNCALESVEGSNGWSGDYAYQA